MKAPKPTTPGCAPKGTVWYGGPIEWFVLHLTVTSRDLVPGEVSRLIGCEPDKAWEAGKPLLWPDGTIKRVPKFGHWSLDLEPKDTDEWDCGAAMMELLQRLPSDIGLWQKLTRQYAVGVTFALLMTSTNKGFELSPAVMRFLGERGVKASFDIYYEPPEKAKRTAPYNRRPTRHPAIPKRKKRQSKS